jgi:UrcA family protein
MNTSTASTGLRGLTASAIFGALAVSFSAVSAADPSSVSVSVKFADLNIAKPSGALVLYNRIRAAARAPAHTVGSRGTQMRLVACTMQSQTQ